MVKVIINDGEPIEVDADATILDVCKAAGINVPTLCYHPRVKALGRCRVCVVETLGPKEKVSSFKLSCSTKIQDGMKVWTNSPAARAEQFAAAEVIEGKQKQQHEQMAGEATEFQRLLIDLKGSHVDDSSAAIVRNMADCVDCGRCVTVCRDIQGMGILSHAADPNAPSAIDTQMGLPLDSTDCVTCGQCAVFCPTGAITERDDVQRVIDARAAGKVLVAQFAPATRVGIVEEGGMEAGSIGTGRMVTLLKKLGFKHVFDTNFTADLTIMEEGTEFLTRLTTGGTLPLLTSCCPGWVDLVEKLYPEFIPNVSTCKSPQMMMGAIIKRYWAKKVGVAPEDIFHVSIMPCTAKKREIKRKDCNMDADGVQDVDIVLTTRELGRWLRLEKIDFKRLKESEPDNPLGKSTGAADIFGVSGGVMEAALRSVYEIHTGEELPSIVFQDCRGLTGIKDAIVDVKGTKVRVAIANTLKNARELLGRIQAGTAPQYHFIEVMACPGGCIGGGGQPRSGEGDVLERRMNGIYDIDERKVLRKSHTNPDITAIYKEYFEKPNSHKAHALLHTSYVPNETVAHRLASAGARRPYPERIVTPAGAAAGAAAARGRGKHVPGEAVTILFATNTGTAEEAALAVNASLEEKGFRVNCRSIKTYDAADLPAEEVVLLMAATTGDGELTEDAVPFWDAISDDSLGADHLFGVKFAVFGLGSSGYEKFCEAGKILHKRMLELGAREIIPTGFGDDTAVEKYNDALEPWLEELPEKLPKELLAGAPALPYKVRELPPSRRSALQPDFVPEGFAPSKIVRNDTLTPRGYPREVRFIEFDLDGSGLEYKTGDHLGIRPRNTVARTTEFLKIMGLDGDALVMVRALGKSKPLSLPDVVTVSQIVRDHFDILGRPTRAFFKTLVKHTSSEEEALAIARLTDKQAYAEFHDTGANYIDVFRDFPSARPSLGSLLAMIPVMKPRLYSIASSPSKVGQKVQLVVVLERFEVKVGKRKGLCTSHLEEALVGDTVNVSLEKGCIQIPPSSADPVVMVGLGTGIAPFRSLLQHRQAQIEKGETLGPALLYYSVRHRDKDYFFEDEWQEMIDMGALTDVVPICSHDTAPKLVFVQDVMAMNPGPLHKHLAAPNSHLLFCGPAAGVPGYVELAIVAAFQKVGGMRKAEAKAFVEKMKTEDRYIVESCGGADLKKKK